MKRYEVFVQIDGLGSDWHPYSGVYWQHAQDAIEEAVYAMKEPGIERAEVREVIIE